MPSCWHLLHLNEGFLLFQPREATQWTFQCSQAIWKPFDDNKTGEGKKCLQVRPSLEVIIASAKAVEGFLGSDDFNSVRRLACGKERSQKISIPFISRFFGFSTIKVDIAAESKLSKAFCFLSCVLTDGELTDALRLLCPYSLLWCVTMKFQQPVQQPVFDLSKTSRFLLGTKQLWRSPEAKQQAVLDQAHRLKGF